MRKLILVLFVSIFTFQIFGQYSYRHPEIFYMPAIGPEKYYADKLRDNVSDNPGLQYRLQTGMFFNSVSGFNSFTSWFSPKVLLPINSRFTVEVGGVLGTTSLYGSGEELSGRINSLVTYARGVFSVNENLTVYGQVAKSMMRVQSTDHEGFESVTMGMEYFVTPNFRIGASITSRNGMNPFYLYSPYNNYYRRPGFNPYYY